MAVVYEKVTLLVANDVGHRLADIGCWEFEDLIASEGFRLIDQHFEELDGPQIIQKDESA